MASRLTDKQKKRIIADYVELGSYRAVGRLHGVSENTVKALVQKDAQAAQRCAEKKEQNTLDMLAYMDSRKAKAQDFLDKCMEMMTTPEKLEAATLNQIATAFGIVVDKFARVSEGPKDEGQGVIVLPEVRHE